MFSSSLMMSDYFLFILVLGIGLSRGRNTNLSDETGFDQGEEGNGTIAGGDTVDNFETKIIGAMSDDAGFDQGEERNGTIAGGGDNHDNFVTKNIGVKGDDLGFDQREGGNGTIDGGDTLDSFGMKIIEDEVRTRGGAGGKAKKCKNAKVCLGSIENKLNSLEAKVATKEDISNLGVKIAEMPQGSELQVVFSKPEQFKMSRNYLVGVLPYLGRQYSIVFQLWFNTLPTGTWFNILHFTINGNSGTYGYRTPSLWNNLNNKFWVTSAIDGRPDYQDHFDFPFATEKWYTIKVSQTLIDNQYVFELTVDSVTKFTTDNTQAEAFSNVLMYAGNPWNIAPDADMRTFTVITKHD